jgi:uncharacterized Zn-finger protein
MPPIRHPSRRSYLDIVLRDDAHLPDPPSESPVMPPRSEVPSQVPFLETVLRWSPAPSPPPAKKRMRRKNGNKVRKPYTCDLCPMAFQRPSALDQHQNKHTGAKRAYAGFLMECATHQRCSLPVNFPAFVCVCGSAFSYKTNLTQHGRGCPQVDGSEEVSPISFIL